MLIKSHLTSEIWGILPSCSASSPADLRQAEKHLGDSTGFRGAHTEPAAAWVLPEVSRTGTLHQAKSWLLHLPQHLTFYHLSHWQHIRIIVSMSFFSSRKTFDFLSVCILNCLDSVLSPPVCLFTCCHFNL